MQSQLQHQKTTETIIYYYILNVHSLSFFHSPSLLFLYTLKPPGSAKNSGYSMAGNDFFSSRIKCPVLRLTQSIPNTPLPYFILSKRMQRYKGGRKRNILQYTDSTARRDFWKRARKWWRSWLTWLWNCSCFSFASEIVGMSMS